MPVAGAIGGALIGGVASVAGAKSQSKSIDSASDAQAKASQDQIALAREQMQRAETLLQPYRDDRATAYGDALLYGSGSYGGAPAASSGSGATQAGQPDWQAYFTNGPGMADEWRRLQQKGATGQFNNDPLQYAQWHYQTMGQKAGWTVPTVGATAANGASAPGAQTVTRDDVISQIESSPLARFALDDMRNTNHLADTFYNEEASQYGDERARGYQVADADYGDASSLYNSELGAMTGLAGQERDTGRTLAEDMSARRLTDASGAKTRLRGEADAAYSGRMSEVDSDYGKRQDLTNAAVSAWQAKALSEQQKAQDLLFSRNGVTGMTGQTTRGVAQVGEEYAQNRSLYEADRNAADWDWRSGESLNTRDARDAIYVGAEDAYGNDVRNNSAAYATDRSNVDQTYYGRVNPATQNYYTNLDNAQRRKYDAYGNFDATYYDKLNGSLRNKNETRQSAYSQFAGGRASAYSDYVNQLNSKSERDFSAARGQVSAGQNFSDSASSAIGAGANAYAQGQYGKAAVTDTMYGDIARSAGDAYGAITNRRPAVKTSKYYGG